MQKREANQEFMRRRQNRLRNNAAAINWLHDQNLSDETIKFFNLGLSEPFTDKNGFLHENALLAPVPGADGKFTNQTIYLKIQGVTSGPITSEMWTKGLPRTYYSEKHDGQAFVVIFDNIFDLWRTRQELVDFGSGSNFLLISSTPNNSQLLPDEWKESQFWERFDHIYLGLQNSASGERQAVQISRTIGRETRRLRPPLQFGDSWVEFWNNGGTVKELQRLIADAGLLGTSIRNGDGMSHIPGRYGYKPVDIATAFHGGYLYYPVETLVNSLDLNKNLQGAASMQLTSRTEVVVVRSDRTIHSVREEAAPRGTPPENRILRLTDGTLVASHPKSSMYSTWSWHSIEAYQQKRSKPRDLRLILRDIKDFLRRSVWLPYEYDYDLLTLLVPVTFAQAIFQAVPMVLVTGEPGSGKSALGRAMCQICANAVPVGQISAAAVARLIHETKGFVLLDDLESIGQRSKGNSTQFSELVQALKLSYNKETSWKLWTDVSRKMRVERLNFFGVKMINNTSGADHILGSRMVKISTMKIPADALSHFNSSELLNHPETDSLRDELHTWAFENVALIDATYKRLFPQPSDRTAEISAPLKVFAELASDEELSKGLELALTVKDESARIPADPIDLMIKAVQNLVRAGYQQISTTHVALEMKSIDNTRPFKRQEPYLFKSEKWHSPAWVGRHLRTYDFIAVNTECYRQSLFGKSLRVYKLKERLTIKINDENKSLQSFLEKKPLDFCVGCGQCLYRQLNCPISSSRMKIEAAVS